MIKTFVLRIEDVLEQLTAATEVNTELENRVTADLERNIDTLNETIRILEEILQSQETFITNFNNTLTGKVFI